MVDKKQEQTHQEKTSAKPLKSIKILISKPRENASSTVKTSAYNDASRSKEIMEGKEKPHEEEEEHHCACVARALRGGKSRSHGPLYKPPKGADRGQTVIGASPLSATGQSRSHGPLYKPSVRPASTQSVWRYEVIVHGRNCPCIAHGMMKGTGVLHGPQRMELNPSVEAADEENGCQGGRQQPLEAADCGGEQQYVVTEVPVFRHARTSGFKPYKKNLI